MRVAVLHYQILKEIEYEYHLNNWGMEKLLIQMNRGQSQNVEHRMAIGLSTSLISSTS
jgi:hypothetical protein